MKNRAICALLLVAVLLCAGCDGTNPAKNTEFGFVDKESGIEYVVCNVIAVKPLQIGEAYCRADKSTYYTIDFEDPKRFLCDFDEPSGSSFVYRNRELPDITLQNFNAISALLYLDGKSPVMVAQLYADDEFLPEELRGKSPSQDTALVREMTDAMLNGEVRVVSDEAYDETQTYYFRLLSQDYPGLYYCVCFFADRLGKYYLEDMSNYRIVEAPSSIVAWFLGSGDGSNV